MITTYDRKLRLICHFAFASVQPGVKRVTVHRCGQCGGSWEPTG
jgi:hypothetical protein